MIVREITNPNGWAIRRFAGPTITTSVKVELSDDPDGPFFLLHPDAAARLEQLLGGVK